MFLVPLRWLGRRSARTLAKILIGQPRGSDRRDGARGFASLILFLLLLAPAAVVMIFPVSLADLGTTGRAATTATTRSTTTLPLRHSWIPG